MNNEHYKGKKCHIKTQGTEGVIENITYRRGAGGALAARYIVKDANGEQHELMPHEIKIEEEPPTMGMSY